MDDPEPPEQLFAAYRALREAPAASRAEYEALGKRTRAAKAAWTKLGRRVERQQLTDLQGYLTQFKPRDDEAVDLTPTTLDRELLALRALGGRKLEGALRALWRRLEETRAHRAAEDADYDPDHDDLADGEAALLDLASGAGVDLSGG